MAATNHYFVEFRSGANSAEHFRNVRSYIEEREVGTIGQGPEGVDCTTSEGWYFSFSPSTSVVPQGETLDSIREKYYSELERELGSTGLAWEKFNLGQLLDSAEIIKR